jgi:tetratricopeptide (TPR) repeat protein
VAAGRLPPNVAAELVDRSDGNPFYMEELTRSVVESLEGTHGEPASGARIPLSLHESLVARLDRLGSARRIVDIGAVIGRQFDYELAAAVASASAAALRSMLAAVKRSGLIGQTGTPPASRYLFRHVLTRDAAYEAMVKPDRRALHDQVATALRTKFPELRDTEPEVTAYHLANGASPTSAIPYWEKAGQKFAARGGHVEAVAHYRAALALVTLLPEGLERLQQELSCLLPLAVSLASSQGYAADEVKDVLTRAREICGLMGDASPLFPVLHGLSKFWTVRGDQVVAEELIRTCAKIAEQAGNPLYVVESDATLAYVLTITGQLGDELALLIARGPRIYDENESVCRQNWSEANAKTSALSVAPAALHLMGDAAGADRAYHQALAWARSLDRPFDLAHTLCFTAAYQIARNEFRQALREAEEAAAICETHGFGVWLQSAHAYKAIAMARLGEVEAARTLMVATLAEWKNAGCNTLLGFFTSQLSLIEVELGHFDVALKLAKQAIELDDRFHDFVHLPGAHQTLARVLARRPRPDFRGAEAALRAALGIARSQGARAAEADILAELAAMTRARLPANG